jgi:hypothetical protein
LHAGTQIRRSVLRCPGLYGALTDRASPTVQVPSSTALSTVALMSVVDDLLRNCGTYIGIDSDVGGHGEAAAKIVVTPLPGGSGVTLDYETFNPGNKDRLQGHAERAIVARSHGGGAVYVTAHIHADTIALLRETDPGVFELGAEPSAFPMRILISVPEPGHLVHSWSYGMPGEEPTERDRAELTLRA